MAEDTQAEAEHRAKMARVKAAKDRLYATKTGEKGLLIVHTGTGKGKSTAAWGLAMRCLGHGLKIGVVQFVKGRRDTGERHVLERFPEQVSLKVMGEGFTWETQDRERDIAAARAAWDAAKAMLHDPELHMVILDELNIVLRKDYLALDEVIEGLRARRPESAARQRKLRDAGLFTGATDGAFGASTIAAIDAYVSRSPRNSPRPCGAGGNVL